MKAWSVTDKGIVRRQNQDTFFAYCDEARRISLILVCDGMGGASSGNVASALSAEVFVDNAMSGLFDPDLSRDDAAALMYDALVASNEAVYEKSLSDTAYAGMGTTFVAALIRDDDTIVMNVGDSRAYHISEQGIVQITRDHSVVADMVARGEITSEEALTHPSRNLITRALGTSPTVNGDFFYPELKNGNFILLCSDGLTNLISDDELFREVMSADNAETCCENLLKQGIARGAPDNITLVLFEK